MIHSFFYLQGPTNGRRYAPYGKPNSVRKFLGKCGHQQTYVSTVEPPRKRPLLVVLNVKLSHTGGRTGFLKELAKCMNVYIDGLMQERHNFIANAVELCLSDTTESNPSICIQWDFFQVGCYYAMGLLFSDWIGLIYGLRFQQEMLGCLQFYL